MVNQAKINFVMIVKDEEKRIRRCLKSIRDVAYAVTILDTGSSDATVEYCRKYTRDVHLHPWEGEWNFGAARNIAFEKGRKWGNWHFIIDADEWMQDRDSGDLLLQAGVNAIGKADCIQVQVHSVFKKTGGMGTWLPSIRMLRNDGTWKYEGTVHNLLNVHGTIGITPIVLAHDGYDLTPAEMGVKHERTCALLLKQVRDSHGTWAFPWYNLVKAYSGHGEHRKAVRCGIKAIPLLKKHGRLNAGDPMANIFHLIAHAAIQDGDTRTAIEFAEKGLELIPDFPDLWFDLGQTYSFMGAEEDMERCFIQFDTCCESVLNGNRMFPQEVTRLDYGAHTWFFRSMCYETMGKRDKVRPCLKKATEINPEWGSPWLSLARLERKEGNWKLALEAYDKCIAAKPDANKIAELAELCIQIRQPDKAKKFMEWAKERYEFEGSPALALECDRWIKEHCE